MTRARNVADIIKQPFTTTLGTSNYRAGVNAGDTIAADASHNVCVGDDAGTAITSGSENVAIGFEALEAEDTRSGSTALGYRALKTQNGDTANTHNVAIGADAGLLLLTGNRNVYVGALSGDANSTGDGNTAVGHNTLGTNTHSENNVAVGFEALKTFNIGSGSGFNTAVGSIAATGLLTGTTNVFLGARAGEAATTCDDSVMVGFNAGGDGVVTGNLNVLVGKDAGKDMTSGNSNTIVGADSGLAMTGAANNTIVGYNSGDIVTGSGNTFLGKESGDGVTGGADNICIGRNATLASATTSNAITLGIGINTAANNFAFGKASNVVLNDFDEDAAFSRASDQRLKTNITAASLGLNFVNDLRPVTYKWKASGDLDANDSELAHLRVADDDGNIINHMTTDLTMHGLIAQEVKTALDTANVSNFKGWSEDRFGVQHISREMYVIPLIKAVQELSTALDAALARIATLEG